MPYEHDMSKSYTPGTVYGQATSPGQRYMSDGEPMVPQPMGESPIIFYDDQDFWCDDSITPSIINDNNFRITYWKIKNELKIALEQSSWEHKSLSLYHDQVLWCKKLDKKMACLINHSMKRYVTASCTENWTWLLPLFSDWNISVPIPNYLLKGEQLFDEASDELVKTTEVMFATQRDDEKKNWSISI